MLDDRAARNCAQALQIRLLGTMGTMVLAKRRSARLGTGRLSLWWRRKNADSPGEEPASYIE